jgi:hypothetical protein
MNYEVIKVKLRLIEQRNPLLIYGITKQVMLIDILLFNS